MKMNPKDLQRWINDKQLNIVIQNYLIADKDAFTKLGYVPIVCTNITVGGKGHEKKYWLDIKEITSFDVENIENEEFFPLDYIEYRRTEPSSIKLSLLYRMIFKEGELKNRSLRGLLLISIIFGSFIFWILFFLRLIILFVLKGQFITSLDGIIIFLFLIVYWQLHKHIYIPVWKLPEHRVIKSPSVFLGLSELDADIEMYRDNERNQITRFTKFIATCPICTADIILREGQPDQKAPLVGRCVESPFAHVYSFDRVTMRGKYLE